MPDVCPQGFLLVDGRCFVRKIICGCFYEQQIRNSFVQYIPLEPEAVRHIPSDEIPACSEMEACAGIGLFQVFNRFGTPAGVL